MPSSYSTSLLALVLVKQIDNYHLAFIQVVALKKYKNVSNQKQGMNKRKA